MKLGIVMPIWIQGEVLLNMTYEAIKSWRCSRPCCAYIVSNRLHGVSAPDFEKRAREFNSSIPLKLLHEDGVERSVAAAWNHGILTAFNDGCDHVLITANDAIHNDDTIDKLIEFGEAHPEVDIWSGVSTRDLRLDSVFDGCDYTCVMLRRSTIEKFGWFDHNFRPAYFEDCDYDARVWLGGGQSKKTGSAIFSHLGSMTSRLDGEAAHHVNYWFPINKKRFIDKWGRGPGSKEDVMESYFKHPWNDASLPLTFCDR